jgi:hypothetical protein
MIVLGRENPHPERKLLGRLTTLAPDLYFGERPQKADQPCLPRGTYLFTKFSPLRRPFTSQMSRRLCSAFKHLFEYRKKQENLDPHSPEAQILKSIPSVPRSILTDIQKLDNKRITKIEGILQSHKFPDVYNFIDAQNLLSKIETSTESGIVQASLVALNFHVVTHFGVLRQSITPGLVCLFLRAVTFHLKDEFSDLQSLLFWLLLRAISRAKQFQWTSPCVVAVSAGFRERVNFPLFIFIIFTNI